MARKYPLLTGFVHSKLWIVLGAGAAASGVALAVQIHLDPAFVRADSLARALMLALCAVLGVPVGLYAVVAASVLSRRLRTIRSDRVRLASLEQQVAELKAAEIRRRERIEELATLREVAYLVNRETDFAIIAQKVLELIADLLDPLEVCVFLQQEPGAALTPFAQRVAGKFLTGAKVQTRTIPGFSLEQLESHGLICRVYGQEFHAIIPLKVEQETLGVLFLIFPTDQRPDPEQVRDFNERRRTLLQEIAQHISLAVKTKHLHMKSVVDGLTRLYSKSHFSDQLEAHIDYTERNATDFSLITLDIDHFKQVNDTYGHASGDTVLAGVAETIRRALRKYDTGYRTGGEELAVLLPRTDLDRAAAIAERLRSRVENKSFRAEDGRRIRVTVSCGAAQHRHGEMPEAIFGRADRRLYSAKSRGRNRVVASAD